MSFTTRIPVDTGVDIHAPIRTIEHSHDAILAHLERVEQLPRLVALAQKTRELAQGTLELFHGEVLRHHQDEEIELFPAVLRSAAGEERHRTKVMILRLQE